MGKWTCSRAKVEKGARWCDPRDADRIKLRLTPQGGTSARKPPSSEAVAGGGACLICAFAVFCQIGLTAEPSRARCAGVSRQEVFFRASACYSERPVETLMQGVVQAQISGALTSCCGEGLELGSARFPSWTSSVRIRSPALTPRSDNRCPLASFSANATPVQALQDRLSSRAVLPIGDNQRHVLTIAERHPAPSWSPARLNGTELVTALLSRPGRICADSHRRDRQEWLEYDPLNLDIQGTVCLKKLSDEIFSQAWKN